jgi:phosphonate transport system substrate-binding protein
MKTVGYIVVILGMASLLPEIGCRPDKTHQRVDFSTRVAVQSSKGSGGPGKTMPLNVVISSIYSAQESFSHYNDLFTCIGRQCGMTAKITYCKNYRETYRLLADGSADVGLICTALYIVGRRNRIFKALVVPVIDGKPTFQAYIIAHDPSPVKVFGDLKGGRFAFTDSLSLTGYLYPLSRSGRGIGFWKKTVFAGPHDYAIDLVQRGIADGASVSSTVFNDVQRNNPERTDHVRVVEKSEEFGMPPIVIRATAPLAEESALKNAFVKLRSESQGWELLQILGIETFTVAEDSLYASAGPYVTKSVVP